MTGVREGSGGGWRVSASTVRGVLAWPLASAWHHGSGRGGTDEVRDAVAQASALMPLRIDKPGPGQGAPPSPPTAGGSGARPSASLYTPNTRLSLPASPHPHSIRNWLHGGRLWPARTAARRSSSCASLPRGPRRGQLGEDVLVAAIKHRRPGWLPSPPPPAAACPCTPCMLPLNAACPCTPCTLPLNGRLPVHSLPACSPSTNPPAGCAVAPPVQHVAG